MVGKGGLKRKTFLMMPGFHWSVLSLQWHMVYPSFLRIGSEFWIRLLTAAMMESGRSYLNVKQSMRKINDRMPVCEAERKFP
jgi:hypothetical protein